jgi:hypothetical protein
MILTHLPAGGSKVKACRQCQQEAEWRYKDGWGVLACADWFSGKCEGEPLDVTLPSVGNMRPTGGGFDEDVTYKNWVNTRLRELWPIGEV